MKPFGEGWSDPQTFDIFLIQSSVLSLPHFCLINVAAILSTFEDVARISLPSCVFELQHCNTAIPQHCRTSLSSPQS
jgi:hypothetical protein